MLFDLDRLKSQSKSGMQMSTNIPSASVRLVRKQKQLLDVRYVLPMYGGSVNDLDLVEFDFSADKSSSESENNKTIPLTQLPAESRLARRQQRRQVLPAMTADRRADTLRANHCVICVLYISQILILSSNDLSERLIFMFYKIYLTVAVCVIKLICLPKG